MSNPNGDPGLLAAGQHEGIFKHAAHALGHVVAEGASILLTPHTHGAESHTGLSAFPDAHLVARHDTNPVTMELPKSWDSTRRT